MLMIERPKKDAGLLRDRVYRRHQAASWI